MRLVHVLVTLLMLSLLPAGTAGADPGPAPGEDTSARQRVRVALETTTPWVRKGGIAQLNGRVRGVRGRATVTIMQRNLGKRTWGVEARKRTTRRGYFKHSERISTGARDYKACVKGRCSKAIRVRQGTPPSKPTALTLGALSVYNVEAGQQFTVNGSAANLDGYSVAIQSYDAGSSSWSSIGSAHVSGGAWSASVSVSTAGKSVPIRAVFGGVPGRKPSVSNSAALAVYGWYYFYDNGPLDEVAGDWSEESQKVNGVVYPKSITDDTWDSFGEADLSRSCLRVAFTLGLSDDSASTAIGTTRIYKDSVQIYSNSNIRLGTSAPVVLDVVNALRLRIEWSPAPGNGGNYWLTYGDARALCAF